jgi:5'-nucleotidase
VRILVTNDDGVESPGVWTLAEGLADAGFEPVIAAPAEDMSGASASIWRMHPDAHVDAVPVECTLPVEVPAWSVEATPGLIVLSAASGAFGEVPALVAVGINAGLNLGESILHSGTIGAALTAQRLGLSALAVSLEPGNPWRWPAAVELARRCIVTLAAEPRGTVLNLNVPDGDDRAPSLRWARLHPHGTVRTALSDDAGGHVQLELRAAPHVAEAEFDTTLLAAGYATVTAIAGVHEAPRPRPVPERALPRVERALRPVPVHSVSPHGEVRPIRPRDGA